LNGLLPYPDTPKPHLGEWDTDLKRRLSTPVTPFLLVSFDLKRDFPAAIENPKSLFF